VSEIRCTKKGMTFRLYGERTAAIRDAVLLSKQQENKFTAKPLKGTGGYVLVSADNKFMYDSSGYIPDTAYCLFKNRGAFMGWRE